MNSGGNINLSNLQSIESNGSLGLTQFLIDVPAYEFPNLVTTNQTQIEMIASFGTLSLPVLTNFENGRLDVPSLVTINAPQLNSIEGSYFRKSGLANVVTAPIFNADNASLHAQSGAVIDIAASSYSNNQSYNSAFISSVNSNSQVNLDSISTFSQTGGSVNTVEASSSGLVGLKAVETINSGGGLRFLSSSSGRINIGGVSQTTILYGGMTRFETTGTNSVIHFGSNLNMAENTALKATLNGRFEAEGDLFIPTQNAANFDLADGTLRMFGNAERQALEVAGTDVGIPSGTLGSNFQIGLLQVGTNTQGSTVILQDASDNNNLDDTEALYLQGFPSEVGLRLLGGSTLILNSVNLYIADGNGGFLSARDLINPGDISAAFGGGTISLTGAVNEVFNGDFEDGVTLPATWNQRGPGMVIPKTEFSTTVAEFTAGSPIEIYQHVSTLNSAFSVNFDALSLDASGTLSLLLDDVVLQSWTAAELAGTKMQSFSYLVDNPDDWGLIDVPLTFHWEANTGDRVYLDNIRLVNANPDPVVVAPESFETSGVVIRGGLAELLTSDNQKLVVATGATSQTIDVNAISPNESPTQFSFTVESSSGPQNPSSRKSSCSTMISTITN